MGEHLPCKQGVMGSNPIISTSDASEASIARETACKRKPKPRENPNAQSLPLVRVQGAVRPAEVKGEEPLRAWAEPNVSRHLEAKYGLIAQQVRARA